MQFDNLFSIKCYNASHSSSCIPVANKIKSIYDSDKIINQDMFTSYLAYLLTNKQTLYYNSQCCGELTIHQELIEQILDTHIPTATDLNMFMSLYNSKSDKNNKYIIKILQKLIDRKITIPPDVLCNCFKNTHYTQHKNIIDLLVKHVQVDTKCIEEACLYGYVDILPQMFGQKVKSTNKALENLISYYKDHGFNKPVNNIIHQVNLLLKYGSEPNLLCLLNACHIKDKNVIEKILSYKIEPDQKCFEALQDDSHYHGYHVKQSRDAVLVAELIDLLIAHGYKLTHNDVQNSLKKGYYINNIKRFNFNFDKKFVEECYSMGYFPYQDLGIKPSIDLLRIECRKTGNITTIKKLVKQGLEPDIDCLRDACRMKSNLANIRYLIEVKKIKPDLQCIKNISQAIHNSSLTYLFTHYNPANDNVTNTNNDADNNSDNDSNSDSDEDIEDKPIVKPVVAVTKRTVKRTVKKSISDNDSDEDVEETPLVKPVATVTKRTAKKSIVPISSDEDSISDDEDVVE